MTTYYVKSIGGSDGADGLTPANSWATVQYADSQISAGDTVWLSPGVHHIDHPWEIATTGTQANPILYKGDFPGAVFDMTRGEVILMPKVLANASSDNFIYQFLRHYMYRRDITMSSANESLLISEGTEFIEWYNVQFGPDDNRDGHSSNVRLVVGSSGASEYAAEGWKLIECTLHSCDFANYAEAFYYYSKKVDADVSDGEGVLLDRCIIPGTMKLWYDESATSEVNLKFIAQSSVIFGAGGLLSISRSVNSTYGVGGYNFYNDTFAYSMVLEGITQDDGAKLFNNFHNGILNGWQVVLGTGTSSNFLGGTSKNIAGSVYSLNGFEGEGIFNAESHHIALGGDGDIMHRGIYGWSPWKPWEPITHGGIKTYGAGGFDTYTFPTYDLYGYPIDAAEGVGYFMIDASYEAISAVGWSDTPDGADAFNADLRDDSSDGTDPAEISAAGVDISDMANLWADGMSGLAIRAYNSNQVNPAHHLQVEVEYLAEGLYDVNWPAVKVRYYDYIIYPDAPAGGWTRDALEKLRLKLNFVGASLNQLFDTVVAPHLQQSNAIGAVASPTKMIEETTVVNTGGGSSGRIAALGWWQKAMYLETGTHTFTVYARYESEYTGTLPTIEVDVPETGDNDTDVMVGAADQWEQITAAVTLTEARTVILRLHSYNTGEGGFCYFDDLEKA